MKKRVVIIGGGITGLAAAHALEKAEDPCDVRLIEAGPHLGGTIETVSHNGFTIDAGPDSWDAGTSHATRLVRDVGLGDELIGTRPDTRRIYVAWQRRLYPVPEGLFVALPTETKGLLDGELLGWDAKMRAALDFVIPRRSWRPEDDESVSAFIARRLGTDVSERIGGPLIGGVFTGDPASLSARACIPQLIEAEREHGSLLKAVRVAREKRRVETAAGEIESALWLSLKRGMGDLVVNVAHKLRDAEVFTSRAVRRVSRLENGDPRGRWVVETSGSSPTNTFHADDVVLAVPGHVAATLIHDVDAQLSAMCDEMAYTSVATIFLAYRKFDVRHPLDAFGIVVPRSENRPILGCTFVSSKWDHRAPAGQVLLRVIVGGGNESAVLQDDDALVQLARSQVRDLLNIERAPTFSMVFRFDRSVAQPRIGHLQRMERLFERVAMHEGLHLGGSGYTGAGIEGAVRQGEAMAARVTPLTA